ncbi:hypothetical protein FRB90_002297, partial [Tulasnella sp. 427]
MATAMVTPSTPSPSKSANGDDPTINTGSLALSPSSSSARGRLGKTSDDQEVPETPSRRLMGSGA